MYNAAIRALGLNYIYVPFAVDDLEKAVEGVRNLGIAAIGVTIPYKIPVIKYLDELDENPNQSQWGLANDNGKYKSMTNNGKEDQTFLSLNQSSFKKWDSSAPPKQIKRLE